MASIAPRLLHLSRRHRAQVSLPLHPQQLTVERLGSHLSNATLVDS